MLLHTPGTMDAFNKISSDQKWLEINGRKKWERFVQPEHAARLRAFYDRFLKGLDNDVTNWPPVRIEVRERYKVGEMYDEQEWPLARTDYQKLYLHTSGVANFEPAEEGSLSYESLDGQLTFDFSVTEQLELTGFSSMRLWVEADGSDDMDLFVGIRKINREGEVVTFPYYTVYNNGEATLGCLRVSHRATDPSQSTPWRPFLTHDCEARLSPSEKVPVDIPLMPSSTLFEKGDTLQVIIQGRDIVVNDENMPCAGHTVLRNKGRHIIYLGGKYDSHVLLPVIEPRH